MTLLSLFFCLFLMNAGLSAQLASVDDDYKTQRINYLKSELKLSPDQVKELTLRFNEIVPEESAADWKKTRKTYESILLEVLNISQQQQLGETYGFNRECIDVQNKFSAKRNTLSSSRPELNTLSLRPNPTSDFVTISYEIKAAGKITLDLKDEQGRTITTIAQGHKELGQYSKRINLSDLASSIYLVSLKSENDILTEKLVLQK